MLIPHNISISPKMHIRHYAKTATIYIFERVIFKRLHAFPIIIIISCYGVDNSLF